MINVKQNKKEFLDFFKNKRLKKVLDLGCGKGLMSSFFSKKGIETKGIDKKNILENNFLENFKFTSEDIVTANFGQNNNLVIASLILHFFDKEKVHKLIEKIKYSTSKRGYNFIICMSDLDDMNDGLKFFPTKKEILSFYEGWTIEKELQDETDFEEHSNLPSHKHNLIFLILKKP